MPTKKKSIPISEKEIDYWFEEDEKTDPNPEQLQAENIESKYTQSQIQIVRTTMDFTLHNLKHMLQDPGYINVSPPYQRRDRWDQKKRSQLIESFLMNIPIPPLFLFENKYNQYEVMDGRQRLQAIHAYMNDEFKLTGLVYWPELDGMSFSKLPPVLQRGLLRRTISAVVLLAETERTATMDVRMILFRRLNTGGVQLNPQELRNALYPGPFNDLLADLSGKEVFKKIWQIPPSNKPPKDNKPVEKNALFKTMADCELVLRFFAIRETIEEGLSGSLRDLLDNCMRTHQNDSPAEIAIHHTEYLNTIEKLDKIFDGSPFILPKTQKPSRPLYDALMVAYALKPVAIKDKKSIQLRLNTQLQRKNSYDVLVGRGNTVDAIRQRVRLASKILQG